MTLSEEQQQALAAAATALRNAASDSTEMKALLRGLIEETWPDLPGYSTLKHPEIHEVATATVSTAVCPYFKNGRGEVMVVLPRAGTHYGYIDDGTPKYTLFGGYVNLTHAPTSETRPHIGEQPREAAVRELAFEELKGAEGEQILHVRPERLQPTDTIMLYYSKPPLSVQQYRFELTPQEAATLTAYTERVANDRDYRHAVRAQTVNPDSGLPEICRTDIVPLSRILANDQCLLYPGQIAFFKQLDSQLRSTAREGR